LGRPFTREFIDQLLDAAEIVRVISDYVPLKQAGARHVGLCPFHEEKTPSFTVSSEKRMFYCFGCQTGGDLIKFITLYENLDFPEAVEALAQRTGIPLPEISEKPPGTDIRKRILEINTAAESFFRQNLRCDQGRNCRAYLDGRGISAETIERLSLGYALDSWDALRTHLTHKQYRPAELLKAGFVKENKQGTGQYDRFRNRLIFPIRDAAGRTVAFGGRGLGDDEPKYLNSPETPAYVKGEHLYGMDLARDAIRREGFAIVVEGYTDLAALLQAGLDNVVASLGTAFTPAQARVLGRYTRRVFVSYDGDTAGSTAAVRSFDLLLARGFEVRVVDLPAGQDPDDFIKHAEANAYGTLVRQAPGYLEYLVNKETRSRDLGQIREKIETVNAVLPHLVKLSSPIERVEWASRLADAIGIDDDLVQQELRSALKQGKPSIARRGTPAGASQGLRPVESRLLALLLGDRGICELALEKLEDADLEGSRIAGIVDTIFRLLDNGQRVDHTSLLDELSDEGDRDLVTRIAFSDYPDSGEEDFEDCLKALRRARLVREQKELRRVIANTADPSALEPLLVRTQNLGRQIDALS